MRRTIAVMEKASAPSGGDEDADARAAALRRHPAARASARGRARLIAAVRARMELNGALHPEVAAAVLAERGRRGLDREAFAEAEGTTVERLQRIEAGECSAEDLPPGLRSLRG